MIEISGSRFAALVVSLLFLGLGLWQGLSWYHFQNQPLIATGYTTVIVHSNATVKKLAAQLKEQKLITRPKFFILLSHQLGVSNKLRMGEYAVDSHTTPRTLLNNIAQGKVVLRKLTLVEGITMKQVRQLLLSNDSFQHVTVNLTDEELMSALGHPHESPEGRFFPDTYVYTWGNKDTVILQQAYQRMNDLLAQEWPQRAGNLPYKSPQEALIVASLVESEAMLAAERPLIAGVIIHRLELGMNLQIDPTVIYGVGKPYGSVITLEDLHNDNPYNTYLHKGLPPTPINMPSAASIYAALHPSFGDALYYVAQGDGSHWFSATYPEHVQAVQKYRDFKKSEADKQKWLGFGVFIIRSTGLY